VELKWMNYEKTVLCAVDEHGLVTVIEPNHSQWADLSSRDNIQDCSAGTSQLVAEIESLAMQRQKQAAYQAESDPLFFKWQAGEITREEWLAKRNQIKERYTSQVKTS
jgi:hypothetical protein